jgi:hypothetical protein
MFLRALPLPLRAFAQPISDCPFPTFLACDTGGAGGLSTWIQDHLDEGLGIVGSLIFLMVFYYAVRLLLLSHEENQIEEVKQALAHIVIAGAVVSLGWLLIEAFAPSFTGASFINQTPAETFLENIVAYLRIGVGLALIGFITVRGFRLILSLGDESMIQKQRTLLLNAIIGVAFALLAQVMVDSVFTRNIVPFGQELAGVANFILVFFGFGCVLAVIIGGFYLIFSVDEGNKEKAKKLIITAVVALLIVLTSFVVVQYFIG